MNALSLYETMSQVSARMVAAAQANDWERLSALEREVASLRDTLASRDRNQPLTASERVRKVALIHRILDDDAQIRRHTEPWMEQVRTFLGSTARGRSMRQAYGAHQPG